MKESIGVLLTCYNRKDKTLACLEQLYKAKKSSNFKIDVFLVDDGSTDKTGTAVKASFPQVNVISGNGNLFWNQGMRLAWQNAIKTSNYDYYIWLNDDTIMDDDAIKILLTCSKELIIKDKKPAIITGACRGEKDGQSFSYGGRSENSPVIPNGKLQEVLYINGNIVLIPSEIYESIGILSNDYTHGIGDYDYGLMAQAKGYKCYTTPKYIAYCPQNDGIPKWCNPNVSIKERWKAFHSPLGLNINEYLIFRRKFFKSQWLIYALKAYLRVLSPTLYLKLKKYI